MLYGAPTPRRRDALRNRSAIVRAASELMMSRTVVLMPEIARRAGVGQATLYRHFRDRPALIAAVVADRLERLETYIAANSCTFRDLLAEVLRTQVAMRPLVEAIGGLDHETRRRYTRRVVATLTPALRRAQTEGQARPDLGPDDLALLFAMFAGALGASGETRSPHPAAERSIALLLDGVCVAAPPPPGRARP